MQEATIDPTIAWKFTPHTLAQVLSNGAWKPYQHLIYTSRLLTKAIAKRNAKILVAMPPRHGKSELISHWFPVWYFEMFPERKIILCSYEASFAETWGRKVRDEIETNRENLRVRIKVDARRANDFVTTKDGGMKTAGVDGPISGRGGDLLIIDDPVKNWKEAMSEPQRETLKSWYDSTFRTRGEPDKSQLILMTRWHEDDLGGYLKNEHGFEEVVLPALAEENDPLGRKEGEPLCPERYDTKALNEIKDGSTRVWNALFQQRPSSAEGDIWKRAFWKFYTEVPKNLQEIIQSWDMRFKEGQTGDWVVGQVWGRSGIDLYLLAQYRGKWSFTQSIAMVARATVQFPLARKKLIENKANGPAIEDQLRKEITGIKLVEPSGGKIARATAAEPALESGHVHLPDPRQFPWVKEFIEEAAAFPKGKHDDQVDAASQAIIFLDRRSNAALMKLIKY